ncbi:hypothetical protein AwErysi_06250 [Erysipelotrichaceae bacterium]|nr:hypothetical protein AwErysi_06250 [Erysipelotrichaceae bacterium]
MSHNYTSILSFIATIISTISILIIIWGVIFTVACFLQAFFRKDFFDNKVSILLDLRIILGSYILLGLEVLIAADIIESVVHRTLDEVLLLIAIVIIRTAISYFLNKEIEEVERSRKANHIPPLQEQL